MKTALLREIIPIRIVTILTGDYYIDIYAHVQRNSLWAHSNRGRPEHLA